MRTHYSHSHSFVPMDEPSRHLAMPLKSSMNRRAASCAPTPPAAASRSRSRSRGTGTIQWWCRFDLRHWFQMR